MSDFLFRRGTGVISDREVGGTFSEKVEEKGLAFLFLSVLDQ